MVASCVLVAISPSLAQTLAPGRLSPQQSPGALKEKGEVIGHSVPWELHVPPLFNLHNNPVKVGVITILHVKTKPRKD